MARKRELTLGSYRDTYAKTGVSIGTWERIERGQNVQRRSLLRAVEALGWPHTAVSHLLEGRDPDAPPSEPQDLFPRFYRDRQRQGTAEELEARLRVVEDLLGQIREAVADLLREDDGEAP